MNKQEIFDKAYVGIMTQGRRAFDVAEGKCQYKDESGHKCAIGHCLPDGHEAFGSTAGIWHLLEQYPDLNAHLGIKGHEDKMFLSNLQSAHDNAIVDDRFTGDYAASMRNIANRHGLTVPKLAL